MQEDIRKAIKILNQGGIVIYPTDTAFGVGCVIDNGEAVERLFEIRKRPSTQAAPVLVDTVKMAQEYLEPIPKEVIDKLVEPYWPGALTIVLPCKIEKVPELVRGGGTTLGVRIPNHKVTRAIIRGVGKPILGPSANFHDKPTPYHFSDLNPEFTKLADYVVPGECLVCKPSTIIDCSKKPWRIIRSGATEAKFVMDTSIVKKTLIINTSSNKTIRVGIRVNGKEHEVRQPMSHQKAQILLPLVDDVLRKYHLKLTDIEAIEVNTGPGSFTGLRVGIAVANALSYALNVPINGQRPRSIVAPFYE